MKTDDDNIVEDKKVYDVGINDAGYVVTNCTYYKRWFRMLSRCYSKKLHDRSPTYKDCTVCKSWRTFSNFKAWMEQQDWVGKELDKDLLVKGNKIYSPSTCVFINKRTNMFLTDGGVLNRRKRVYLQGVKFESRSKKYLSYCNNPFVGKSEKGRIRQELLGKFDTEIEAHNAWRLKKYEHACALAELEENPLVKNALRLRFSVEDLIEVEDVITENNIDEVDYQTKINVVDDLCGTGKSHWMIEQMKSQPEKRWLWVTPFLSESGDDDSNIIGRVREQTMGLDFKTPSSKRNTKSKSLESLLREGENISMTHSLFMKITPEALECIKLNKYNIVIDETIEKIELHDKPDEIKSLVMTFIQFGAIQKEESGRLKWVLERDEPILNEEKLLCEQGRLYLFDDKLLIKRYSSLIYEIAESVTILTYMFDHSIMRAWFIANNIKWNVIKPELRISTKERKDQIRNLVKVIKKDNKELSDLKGEGLNAFSSSWYEKLQPEDFEVIKTFASSLYQRWYKGNKSASEMKIMYTTFKKYKDLVAGKGTKSFAEGMEPFVAKNSRASNEHADCNRLINWCNTYPHVSIQMYLRSILPRQYWLDEDGYALSELIQWVFRSAIRNGEPIEVYIASDRMRRLFVNWLNN
jgi:hypothetical protein